ncbi:MAG: S-adenosylmethionine:tRNA ribosyltransferase-isomerase [Bacteroidetes bacterium HLUCCA01]|nr:MAG: S-adenosylmethionine:tRNA ribosyltransferase-isomerase [Bacteroidetes bacterium HLUCCA01]
MSGLQPRYIKNLRIFPSMYTINDFDFTLPEALIAQRPASPRDHARLLVYDRKTRAITDDVFYNIGNWLPKDTTIVVNNSKVEKARMVFGGLEIFVLRQINDTTAEALVRPGKKFRPGKITELAPGLTAETLEMQEDGVRTLKLHPPLTEPAWEPHRLTPFPPYIAQDESLADEYQTVYAKDEGSKAAPTAGLHFTTELLDQLQDSGRSIVELTLHVGMGTFAPVKVEQIEDHVMHSEWYSIDAQNAGMLERSKHITAVGTTSARTLESIADGEPHKRIFAAGSGSTDIFITPGYTYRGLDALITNFHLPKSTLLMLVAALTGLDEMHRIYAHAIAEKYRFYSFGDAMLIL